MAETVKILRRMSMEDQSADAYESGAMYAMPLLTGHPQKSFAELTDESISGVGFTDIPQQGPRKVGADGISMNVDKVSSEIIMTAGFGNVTAKVFTLGSHTKCLSVATEDAVKTHNKYGSVFMRRLAMHGSVGNLFNFDMDLVGELDEDRTSDAFPTSTAYDEPFTFHEMGGTSGYFRVADATDALDSGDNLEIESFDWEFNNGFDHQHCNDGLGILTPVWGQSNTALSGSFTVSRHDSDTWFGYEEDHTPLQLSAYIYKSATATLLIEIPRFIVTVEASDDDMTKLNVTMKIGRNGIGDSYQNSNMSFVSPIRATLVNA